MSEQGIVLQINGTVMNRRGDWESWSHSFQASQSQLGNSSQGSWAGNHCTLLFQPCCAKTILFIKAISTT